jgi:hypothetical protein
VLCRGRLEVPTSYPAHIALLFILSIKSANNNARRIIALTHYTRATRITIRFFFRGFQATIIRVMAHLSLRVLLPFSPLLSMRVNFTITQKLANILIRTHTHTQLTHKIEHMQAIPANAVTLMIYEYSKDFLGPL